MTREEAIRRIKEAMSTMWKGAKEAIQTVIPELAESEDERIRRHLIDIVEIYWGKTNDPGKAAELAWLEKQKDANKAIEAVERIDKYIDENLANAHDMKDSNPDKKYYRGWDDALGEMARILQDVYSGEKQKEPHYTKRNTLFDKCVENCDPAVMKKVSNEIDEMLEKKRKPNLTPKIIRPKFAVGDTVCRHMWSDHTIREIYIDCDDPVYICVNEEGSESHISFSEQDEWKRKEQKPITESKRLANEVIEYLTKCGYSPVLKDDSKKDYFHIDIPRHEDDFWHSEEYKHCCSVLGEYYMEGDYGSDTYTLYVWREKKDKKPAKYLDKNMVYAIMNKLHKLAMSQLIPIDSDEYKKIDEITSDVHKFLDYPIEQKPVEWSEEDETYLQDALWCVKQAYKLCKTENDTGACWSAERWLKSLPLNLKKKNEDVIKLCSNEWSDEDEEILNSIIKIVCGVGSQPNGLREKQVNFLKSLLERKNPQPKNEWSEEDEKDVAHIIRILDDCYAYGRHDLSKTDHENLVSKLKSFRPSWKPSEEQIRMLDIVISDYRHACTEGSDKKAEILKTVLEQLEKL